MLEGPEPDDRVLKSATKTQRLEGMRRMRQEIGVWIEKNDRVASASAPIT